MSLQSDKEFSIILEQEVGDFLREQTDTPELYSNAMRHIYASAVFTQMRGKLVARLYGILNEALPLSGIGDMMVDLNNNAIGREYGINYPTLERQMLLKVIFEDLRNAPHP